MEDSTLPEPDERTIDAVVMVGDGVYHKAQSETNADGENVVH